MVEPISFVGIYVGESTHSRFLNGGAGFVPHGGGEGSPKKWNMEPYMEICRVTPLPQIHIITGVGHPGRRGSADPCCRGCEPGVGAPGVWDPK